MKQIKKNKKNAENLVLDTQAGEMPDPKRKLVEKASDAAQAFKSKDLNKSSKPSGRMG